jgi:hypothetical protein
VRVLADINNDRRADIVGFGDDGVWVSLSLGASFESPRYVLADFGTATGWTVADHPRVLADVNSDGMADIVAFGYYGTFVALSNGYSFGPVQQWSGEFGFGTGWTGARHVRTLADIDLDGRADIVAFSDSEVRVARAGAGSFAASQPILTDMVYNSGWRTGRHPRFVADADGDDLPDLIGFGSDAVYVSRNIVARTFTTMSPWAIRYNFTSDAPTADGWGLPVQEYLRGIADLDADGAMDLYAFKANGLHTTDLSVHFVP